MRENDFESISNRFNKVNEILKFNKVNEAKLDQGSELEVKSLVINIHVVFFFFWIQISM